MGDIASHGESLKFPVEIPQEKKETVQMNIPEWFESAAQIAMEQLEKTPSKLTITDVMEAYEHPDGVKSAEKLTRIDFSFWLKKWQPKQKVVGIHGRVGQALDYINSLPAEEYTESLDEVKQILVGAEQ